MVTCYEEKLPDWYANYNDVKPTLDGNMYPGLSDWQLEMLMKWAAQDPVSQKEIIRNNAVYDIQSNRNPFIDYPGLEQFIWGDMRDVNFQYDTSNIQQVEESPVDIEEWYSLDGCRLEGKPNVKGVYINKRHKVLIR